MALELEESREDGVLLLAPRGNLESVTSPEMERRVAALLQAGEKRFIIDCRGLNYVSSAGLRVLLMLAKSTAARGGGLVVCGLNESVREVFDISGFTRLFAIASSTQEALERMRSLASEAGWLLAVDRALRPEAERLAAPRGPDAAGGSPSAALAERVWKIYAGAG